MRKYEDHAQLIPWKSLGRQTPASRLARSIVPVGTLPFVPLPLPESGNILTVSSTDEDLKRYLMGILGTAIQVGKGKLITCAHVVRTLVATTAQGYILAPAKQGDTTVYVPYRISRALAYIDPRTNQVNSEVDVTLLLVPADDTARVPYKVPPIRWGDSARVGVGDPVLLAGYPLGEQLFLSRESNRGIIQPSFYGGIVSAVLPSTTPQETRLFQVSVIGAGGLSGGPMLDPKTGRVLGIVTSGLISPGTPPVVLPMTYVLPSEVIRPYADMISFDVQDAAGRLKRWR